MNPLSEEIKHIAEFKQKLEEDNFSKEDITDFVQKMEDLIIQIEMTNQINSRLQHTLLRANRKIKQLSDMTFPGN